MPDTLGHKLAKLAQWHTEATEIDTNEATVLAAAYRARCRVAEAWSQSIAELQSGPALEPAVHRILTVSSAMLAQLQTRIAVAPPIAPTEVDDPRG
jgi:hypothetical protein